MAKNLISGQKAVISKGKAKKQPVPPPPVFPSKIELRVHDLVPNEKTQECRVLVIWPDGFGYSGEATILREGPYVHISLRAQL